MQSRQKKNYTSEGGEGRGGEGRRGEGRGGEGSEGEGRLSDSNMHVMLYQVLLGPQGFHVSFAI